MRAFGLIVFLAYSTSVAAQPEDFYNLDNIEIRKLDSNIYSTDHCLFIVADTTKSDWNNYYSVNSALNHAEWYNTFLNYYPGDYSMLTFYTHNLSPSKVPHVTGLGGNKICVYHNGETRIPWDSDIAFQAIDHEIGHLWFGHWPRNGTVVGQMAGYTYDAEKGVVYICGDPIKGFFWKNYDFKNEVFVDQTLYFMGMGTYFPSMYLLNDAKFNADSSVGYSSYNKIDSTNYFNYYNFRREDCKDHRSSKKQYKIGFVSVFKDTSEVYDFYKNHERAIRIFSYNNFKGNSHTLVPFLEATKQRGSVYSRLNNLDGNSPPFIRFNKDYVLKSRNNYVNVEITHGDPDGDQTQLSLLEDYGIFSIEDRNLICENDNTTGTYFLTVQITDSGGKVSYGHMVYEIANRFETNETITICEGESYQDWNTSGTYQRTLSSSLGCDSMISTYLTVNPKYDITEAITICEGEFYQDWNTTGDYQRVFSSSTGCDSIVSTHLTVVTPPDSPIITQIGDTLISNYTSGNQWYFNDEIITEATSQVFTISKSGVYKLVIIDINGCDSDPSEGIQIIASDIVRNNQNFIEVYPNPSAGLFTISGLNGKNASLISVYSEAGSLVMRKRISTDIIQIDLSQNPDGIYFLNVNDNTDETIKLIKR